MPEDLTPRLTTALQGRYTIERKLGEGGMATVYLAQDLKHNRKVALKVLKPELAAVVGAERFLAEIEVTANLQHPHILPLFDSGEADGFLFYVMPFVEGETLQTRLARERQLPVDEAVRIATQVAMALQTAHEQGVVHRDIKPANILMSRGEPLVADFGIALAVGAAGGARLTETGLSVGTPYYMSPEQATGDQAVGPATDIYALGCVAYEMLVGEPPYLGNTAQAVLGKILAESPRSPTVVRKSIPLNVEAAVLKALEKLPADRFPAVQEFAAALANPAFRYGEAAVGATSAADGRWKRVAMTSMAVAATAIGALGWSLLRPASEIPIAQFSLAQSPGEALQDSPIGASLDISDDGSTLVYLGPSEDFAGWQLWVKRTDELRPRPLQGTRGALAPALSPGGDAVAFGVSTGGALQVALLRGGPARTVVDSIRVAGMDWAADGFIYHQSPGFGLARVPAVGGPVEVLTAPDPALEGHYFPDVLPNGKAVVFSLRPGGNLQTSEIAVLNLATGTVEALTAGTHARYAASGHLLWMMANGTLMRAPFDEDRLEITGPAVPVLESLSMAPFGSGQFDVSDNGTFVYRTGGVSEVEPVWVTRDGAVRAIEPGWQIGNVPFFQGVGISPDGTRLALSIPGNGVTDIWVKQLAGGPLSRLTFEGTLNFRAGWTPDGESVTFLSDRSTPASLWRKRADGTGAAEVVFRDDRRMDEGFVSPDGSWIVYRAGSGNARDIYATRLGADTTSQPLVVTDFEERAPNLSPDGRWLAYVSDESGQDEVYVRPFPEAETAKWQVSSGGGTEPVWAHSGRELFFKNGALELVSAAILTEPTFSTGRQTNLFATVGYMGQSNHAIYAVHPSDSMFAMFRTVQNTGTEVVWVQNWFAELERTVGN